MKNKELYGKLNKALYEDFLCIPMPDKDKLFKRIKAKIKNAAENGMPQIQKQT